MSGWSGHQTYPCLMKRLMKSPAYSGGIQPSTATLMRSSCSWGTACEPLERAALFFPKDHDELTKLCRKYAS